MFYVSVCRQFILFFLDVFGRRADEGGGVVEGRGELAVKQS